MNRYIFIFFLVFLNGVIQAQDIMSATLVWRAEACLDINNGIPGDSNDVVTSFGKERIEWRNAIGDTKAIFTILEVNGRWANVMDNGFILYEIESEGRQGTLQFARQAGLLSIQIVLLSPDASPDIYRFSVSTVNSL